MEHTEKIHHERITGGGASVRTHDALWRVRAFRRRASGNSSQKRQSRGERAGTQPSAASGMHTQGGCRCVIRFICFICTRAYAFSRNRPRQGTAAYSSGRDCPPVIHSYSRQRFRYILSVGSCAEIHTTYARYAKKRRSTVSGWTIVCVF